MSGANGGDPRREGRRAAIASATCVQAADRSTASVTGVSLRASVNDPRILASRPMLRHFDSPGRSRATVTVLVLIGVALIAGTFVDISPPTAASHGAPSDAATRSQLVAAERSLANGAGPAAGTSWSCASSGTLSIRCDAGLSSEAVSPTSATWTNLTDLVRPPLPVSAETAMTWDASDGYVLLWGGLFGEGMSPHVANETWTYSNGTWTNITSVVAGGHPAGIALGGLAYDPTSRSVIAFGGQTLGDELTNATWSYHDLVWTNLSASAGPAPSPRFLFAFSEDSADREIVLFGGVTTSSSGMHDTWVFRGGRWSDITLTADFPTPGLAAFPSLSDDPAVSGALMVCTGLSPGGRLAADTFEFRNGTWTNLTPYLSAGPPVTILGSLDWFGQGGSVVLGAEVQFRPDGGGEFLFPVTWAFTQGRWVNLSSQLFPPSLVLAGAASIGDGSVLVYGGVRGYGGTESFVNSTFVVSRPPSASPLTASADAVDAGTTVDFTGTPTGGVGPREGNFTFGDGSSVAGANATASHSYSSPGTYLVNYTVTDWLGRTATASTAIAVNPDISIAALTASASNATAGSTVLLAAEVTGGTGLLSYSWNFGDGTTANATLPTHIWTSAGTYLVNLTVTDSVGRAATASTVITVDSDEMTIALLTASATNVTVGSPVLFGASVSGGTAPLSYSWSFGDGTTSSAGSPTHDWTNAGVYTVNLTVTDSLGGRASKSLTMTVSVTVSSPGSPGSSWTSGSGLIALLALVAIGVALVSVLGTILWTRRSTGATGGPPASWQTPTPLARAGTPPSPGIPSATPPEDGGTPPRPPPEAT